MVIIPQGDGPHGPSARIKGPAELGQIIHHTMARLIGPTVARLLGSAQGNQLDQRNDYISRARLTRPIHPMPATRNTKYLVIQGLVSAIPVFVQPFLVYTIH